MVIGLMTVENRKMFIFTSFYRFLLSPPLQVLSKSTLFVVRDKNPKTKNQKPKNSPPKNTHSEAKKKAENENENEKQKMMFEHPSSLHRPSGKRSAHFDHMDDTEQHSNKRLRSDSDWPHHHAEWLNLSPPLDEYTMPRDGFFPDSPPASPEQSKPYSVVDEDAEAAALDSVFASSYNARDKSEAGLRIIDLSSGEELTAIVGSSATDDDHSCSQSPSRTTSTFNLAKRHRDSLEGFDPENSFNGSLEVQDEEMSRPVKKLKKVRFEPAAENDAEHIQFGPTHTIDDQVTFWDTAQPSKALSTIRRSPLPSICLQSPFALSSPSPSPSPSQSLYACPASIGSQLVLYNSPSSLPHANICWKDDWTYSGTAGDDDDDDDTGRLVELDNDEDVKMMDADEL